MDNLPDVGTRIRILREQRGLSLRSLADRCKLSINAISRIERGESSPTVTSLHQLAVALDIPITDLFTTSHEKKTVFLKQANRSVIGRDGMLIEGLGFGLRNQQLEPLLISLEAGETSEAELITHPGEEFVYCLEGSLSYQVGDQIYLLEAGDSMLFEATQPHGFYNTGSARVLLVFQGHVARRHHIE